MQVVYINCGVIHSDRVKRQHHGYHHVHYGYYTMVVTTQSYFSGDTVHTTEFSTNVTKIW